MVTATTIASTITSRITFIRLFPPGKLRINLDSGLGLYYGTFEIGSELTVIVGRFKRPQLLVKILQNTLEMTTIAGVAGRLKGGKGSRSGHLKTFALRLDLDFFR